MNPRRIGLAVALAATLAAAFWPRPPEAPEVVGALAMQRPMLLKLPVAPLPSSDIGLGKMAANLFPSQTWRAPPPPAPKYVPPPPPPPSAPPLPFRYVGRWKEGGQEFVFLSQSGNLVKGRVGDNLFGWRLDGIAENSLTFTWIALNQQQILRIAP
jgi:hypothetical protein